MAVSTRVFVAAAALCGAAWVLKILLIAAQGGTDEGAAIAFLWGLGMLSLLVASAAGAVAALHSRPGWQRALGGLAAVPLSFVAVNVIDSLVKSVYPGTGWFRDELALVLIGSLMAAAAVSVLGRGSVGRDSASRETMHAS